MNINFLDEMKSRLIKEFLDLLILSRLKNAPSSGYDIARYITKKYKIYVSSGNVYSTLYSLERKGLSKAKSAGKKRLYFISAKGEDVTHRYLDNYDRITEFATAFFGDLCHSVERQKQTV